MGESVEGRRKVAKHLRRIVKELRKKQSTREFWAVQIGKRLGGA